MAHRSWRLPILVAAMAWSQGALAQSDDVVARSNTLFEEGKKLLAEGKVGEACDKLAESNRLAARGGTLLNLGMCHEQQGKLLAARRELRDALAVAKRDARADRIPVATEHLAAVEARLSYVKVVPPPNVGEDQLDVRVDDVPIAKHEWPAVAVEAGHHVVTASAAGFRTRDAKVDVKEGPSQKLTVTFEALESDANAKPPPPPKAPAEGVGALPPPVPDPAPASSTSTLRTVALVAGVTGFVVSLATGAWALDRKSVVRDHCNSDSKLCDSTGADAASLGRTLVIASTAAFAIGAVGIGAWFFWPTDKSSGTRAAGASVGWSF